jgi:Flp pilus assembly protein TadD
VYRQLGQYEAAIDVYQTAIALDSKDAIAHSSLLACYRQLGRIADYDRLLPDARRLVENENEYNRACFEAIVGNGDEALALLETGLQKSQAAIDWARNDPDFENIRDDPRFIELVGR